MCAKCKREIWTSRIKDSLHPPLTLCESQCYNSRVMMVKTKKQSFLGSPTVISSRPFYLFEYEGMFFAFHYSLGRSVRVSRDAYECLHRLVIGNDYSIADKLLANEICRLRDAGFFDHVNISAPNDRQFAYMLEQRYSTPWTKLELALAETCNLACRYCYCGTCRGEIPNQGLMNKSVARQAINGLFAISGKAKDISITFFGGEPLSNKSVLKFVIDYSQKLARLHGKRVFYSMTTNGTLMDDEIVSLIKRFNFGLMVSLDGPKELHDAQCPTCGGEGSYDIAVAGIRKLMSKRRRVTVRCTMAHPVPNMMSLIRFFEGFGFSRIVLGRVYNPVYHSSCDLDKSDYADLERQMNDEVVPWILSELKAGRTPKYFPFSGILSSEARKPQSPVSPFRCGACRGTTTVGADGTLYPCHRFVGMAEWVVGSVSCGPDIERCKNFWRRYRELIKERCFGCWAYPLCKGPCPWEAARKDGTFKLDESTCDQKKIWIKQGAWFEFLYCNMNSGEILRKEGRC